MKIFKRNCPSWAYLISLLLVLVCAHLALVNAERKISALSGGASSDKAQAKIAPEPVKSNNNLLTSENADNSHQAADKKQGDSSPSSSAASQSSASAPAAASEQANQESEYVQIKPEEIGAGSSLKSEQLLIDQSSSASDSSASSSTGAATSTNNQKPSPVDDELNAHLAGQQQQDSISSQESVYQSYAELAPSDSRSGAASVSHQMASRAGYPQGGSGRATSFLAPGPAQELDYPLSAPALTVRAPHHPRSPLPGYTTMKGKLTGINPIVGQYPHPAPGYPHQVARHLPRGAAAGYAAFRDFVRAHASKYKQSIPGSSGNPSVSSPIRPYAPLPPPSSYPQARQPNGRGNKLSVAQAYIPHLNAAASPPQDAYSRQQQHRPQQQYTNSMLTRLYGQHAPVGTGRPEYNKDFGMVIHYPQATVYTEPMTVDQLHKLTGAGISQLLTQLQHQIASGHRDESNTIRSNGRHHLGHGLSIHAKEYYAPGKGGRYVPTTAAVISSSSASSSGQQYQAAEGDYSTSGNPSSPYLGSGYERVKQAVANSQSAERYKSAGSNTGYPLPAYPTTSSGAGEPLAAISNLIGSELDSLYRANAALNKHIEQPEVQAQIQSYAQNAHSKGPLRYQDLTAINMPRPSYPIANSQRHRQHSYAGQRARNVRRGLRNQGFPGNRQPQQIPHLSAQAQYRLQSQSQYRPLGYANGKQQQQQMSQAAYQAAEQALNQQMMQLLHDFQSGDEQYNGRPNPSRPVNQGYPHKVMAQKYQQHQQQYPQQSTYNQHEGVEIVAGQNDQIGEIADLIEALKNSLEDHRPDPQQVEYAPKQAARLTEDVRYLATALGQTPSYAMQVPVTTNEQSTAAPAYLQQVNYQQIAATQAHEQQKATQEQVYSSSGYQQLQQPQDQNLSAQADYTAAAQRHPSTQVIAGSFPQDGAVAALSQQQHQQSTAYPQPVNQYTTSEHSHVINHLVPVAVSHEAHSGYQQQPLNPIALAAPTESQYQQAQPLSSFVESLPNDYQELLRQPLSLGGESTNQYQQSSTYRNATSLAASSASYSQVNQPVDLASSQYASVKK